MIDNSDLNEALRSLSPKKLKYPLGFAILEWKSGGYSEAVFYQDHQGEIAFQCANWLPSLDPVYLSNWEHKIANIITDIEEIYDFMMDL